MYYILKKGRLREIIKTALEKAGSFRKLEAEVQIPKSCLFIYSLEKRAIKNIYLDKLIDYLKISFSKEDIIEELPDNWKQIKGGKNCVERKKENGTFEEQMKKCRNSNPESLRLWHKKMREKNIQEYYLMQYSRFKKIGDYKFLTNNNEKVRNRLEKEVADVLKGLGISYEYEPLVKAGGKHFFPDFLIDNKIIIECTEWRGYDKAVKLKEKIKYLEKKYTVYVVIPKTLKRYYETLNQHLILDADNLSNIFQKSE